MATTLKARLVESLQDLDSLSIPDLLERVISVTVASVSFMKTDLPLRLDRQSSGLRL